MKKYLPLAILLFFSISAFSQGEPSYTNDIVSLLTHKRILSQAEADSFRSAEKPFKPSIEAHAMAHVSFKWQDNTNPSNTFQLERAFIFANAKFTPNIDMFGLYYFSPEVISMVHELWGRWKIRPEFGIRAGLMKVPFTFENLVPTTQLHTIDFSQADENLAGVTTDVIGVNVGRDIGIEVFGELLPQKGYNLLFYNLGVFNGSGVRTLKDLNSSKDFVFMTGIQPLKGWKLQGSAIFGTATYERPLEEIPMGEHVRNRWSIGSQVDTKKFYSRVEYISGRDADIDRHGFYALALYRPLPKLDLVAAYDWYNRDKRSSDNVTVRYNFGFTWWFNSLMRIQTFYTINTKPSDDLVSNRFMTQLQIGF